MPRPSKPLTRKLFGRRNMPPWYARQRRESPRYTRRHRDPPRRKRGNSSSLLAQRLCHRDLKPLHLKRSKQPVGRSRSTVEGRDANAQLFIAPELDRSVGEIDMANRSAVQAHGLTSSWYSRGHVAAGFRRVVSGQRLSLCARAVFFFLAFAAALVLRASPGMAQALDCSVEGSLKAIGGQPPVDLTFINTSAEPRHLYWIDYQGQRKPYAVIAPGSSHSQPSSIGNHWVVTDAADNCLAIFAVSADRAAFVIGGLTVAQMPGAAAPNGVQQPIGQVAVPQAPATVMPSLPPDLQQAIGGLAAPQAPTAPPQNSGNSAQAGFDNPTVNGAIVDWCSPWAQNCGAGGANQYCQLKGFAGAVNWTTYQPGKTWVFGSNQYCSADYCTGFSHVTCTN
jgi:hypothetical protein